MKLKHGLPRGSVELVEFIEEGFGEAGWIVYLNPVFSFDPMSNDYSRFVPLSDPSEVEDFVVFKVAV